jgi:hypothetical protein
MQLCTKIGHGCDGLHSLNRAAPNNHSPDHSREAYIVHIKLEPSF